MKIIKDIDFDSIQLFETSILGRSHFLAFGHLNFICIPCFNLVLNFDGRKADESYINSILIFNQVRSLSVDFPLYRVGKKSDFSGRRVRWRVDFEADVDSLEDFELSNLGITEAGTGWLSYSLRCLNANLLFDHSRMGYSAVDYREILQNQDIRRRLVYPDMENVRREIIKHFEVFE